MLITELGIDDAERLVAPGHPLFDERTKYPVLLVDTVEEGANVPFPAESASCKFHGIFLGCHVSPPYEVNWTAGMSPTACLTVIGDSKQVTTTGYPPWLPKQAVPRREAELRARVQQVRIVLDPGHFRSKGVPLRLEKVELSGGACPGFYLRLLRRVDRRIAPPPRRTRSPGI